MSNTTTDDNVVIEYRNGDRETFRALVRFPGEDWLVGFATVAEEELTERDGANLDEENGEIHPSNADYGHLDPNTRNVIHKGTIRRIMPRNTEKYSETGQVVYLAEELNGDPYQWGNLAERIVGRLRKTDTEQPATSERSGQPL